MGVFLESRSPLHFIGASNNRMGVTVAVPKIMVSSFSMADCMYLTSFLLFMKLIVMEIAIIMPNYYHYQYSCCATSYFEVLILLRADFPPPLHHTTPSPFGMLGTPSRRLG